MTLFYFQDLIHALAKAANTTTSPGYDVFFGDDNDNDDDDDDDNNNNNSNNTTSCFSRNKAHLADVIMVSKPLNSEFGFNDGFARMMIFVMLTILMMMMMMMRKKKKKELRQQPQQQLFAFFLYSSHICPVPAYCRRADIMRSIRPTVMTITLNSCQNTSVRMASSGLT